MVKKRQVNAVTRIDNTESRIYECKDMVCHALHAWSTMNSCSQISSRTHFPRVFGAVTQHVKVAQNSFQHFPLFIN